MAQITQSQAAGYLARWRIVHEQAVAKLRATPVEQKFRQLCALAASRDAFPVDPDREAHSAEVAARWRRIRACCGG